MGRFVYPRVYIILPDDDLHPDMTRRLVDNRTVVGMGLTAMSHGRIIGVKRERHENCLIAS